MVAYDAMRLGGLFDVFGRLVGAIVSYVVVGAILLDDLAAPRLVVVLARRAGHAGQPDASSSDRCSGARPTSARRPGGSSRSAPTPSPGCACCAASAASRPSCAGTRSSRSRCVGRGYPGRRRPGGARRRPGAAARHLRRRRDLARRPLGAPGRHQRRASSWRSTATPRSSSCRCGRRSSSSTAASAPRSRAGKMLRVLAVQPDHARPARAPSPCHAADADLRATRLSTSAAAWSRARAAHRDRVGAPRGVRRPGRPAGPVRSGRRTADRLGRHRCCDLPIGRRPPPRRRQRARPAAVHRRAARRSSTRPGAATTTPAIG